MLLINLINIRRGGAKQVALSFLDGIRVNDLSCIILINETLLREVDITKYCKSKTKFIISELKITQPFKVLKLLRSLKIQYGINKIVVLFGPFYSLKSCYTLSGFADGWAYLETSQLGWSNPFKRLMKVLFAQIKLQITLLSSDEVFVETDYAKGRITAKKYFLKKPIHVVPNAINERLITSCEENFSDSRGSSKYKLIYVASYYDHKNFTFWQNLVKMR